MVELYYNISTWKPTPKLFNMPLILLQILCQLAHLWLGNLPLVSCLAGVSFWFDYISCKSQAPLSTSGISILKFIYPPHLVLPFGLRSNGYTSVLVIYPSAGISSSFVIQTPPASRFSHPSAVWKSWFASWTSFLISSTIFCVLHLFWLLQEICKS